MSIFEQLNKIIVEAEPAPEQPQEAGKTPEVKKEEPPKNTGVDSGENEDVKYETFNVHFAELPESFKKEVMEALQAKLNFPSDDKRALDVINSKLSSVPFYTGTIDDFINKYQIKL